MINTACLVSKLSTLCLILHYRYIRAYARQVFLLEEGKVHASVAAMLNEARMLGEVVLLAVLKDKETILLEEVVA